MTITPVGVGASANDGTGDSLRSLAQTVNLIIAAIGGVGTANPVVKYATSAALASNTYSAGVLTATANGALSVDGATPAVADRILVKDEASQLKNGVYVVTTVGTAGTPYVLTRADDYATWDALAGSVVFVQAGTANDETAWQSTADAGGTLGTTAIAYVQVSSGTISATQWGYLAASTAFGGPLLAAANIAAFITALGGASALRTAAGVAIGTDVLAYDADVFYKDVGGTVSAATTFSANLAFSTYLDFTFVTGNANGRITGRYNTEGTFHDALVLSDNYKWDTGAIDHAALGTAMVLVKAQSSGPGLIEFWTGAVNTAPTRRAYVDASGVWSAGALALTTATGAQLAAANTFTSSRQIISTTAPIWELDETDGGSNQRFSRMRADSGVLHFEFVNDAYNSAMDWLSVTRSANTPLVAEFDTCDLRIEPTPASLATNSAGFRGLGNPSVKTADYTFVIGDAGQMVRLNSASSRNFTIPTFASVAYPNGTLIPVSNYGAGTCVILAPSGGTLYDEDGTSGSVTLNQHHGGVLERDADSGTNVWRYRGQHA